MFGIEFSEFLIIGVIALIVLGPERLPKVARTAGHLFGRLQRYASDVKQQVKNEMEAEDFKKLQSEFQAVKDAAGDMENKILQEAALTEAQLKTAADTTPPSSLEFVEPAAEPPALAGAESPSTPAPTPAPTLATEPPQLELPLASDDTAQKPVPEKAP